MIKAILFDFDGTLINTHDLIIEGFNQLSQKYRGRAFGADEHNKILGKPLEVQVRHLCPFDYEEALASFKSWYQANHDHHAKGYKDIEDTLQLMKDEGYRLGIVTNNSRIGMQSGLNLLGLEHYFEVIITRDDVSACKPSPEGIHKALESLKINSSEAFYVGDSLADIHAARAAGVHPLLVGWTSLTHEQIRSISPIDLIESPFDIPLMLSLPVEKVG